jgi:uncharacterized protein
MTAAGPARVVLEQPERPTFLVVLTHGAGGSPDTADVLAVRDAARELGAATALVTQPYRVKGGRAPGSAAKQDAAWVELVEVIRAETARDGTALPLVQGGRSNGARVVCRTAPRVQPVGVIALAFPLHPPGQPGKSREGELRGAGTSVLVINGERDPFGVPEPDETTEVVVLPGEAHALSKHPAAVGAAVAAWLPELLTQLRLLRLGPSSGERREGPGNDGSSALTRGGVRVSPTSKGPGVPRGICRGDPGARFFAPRDRSAPKRPAPDGRWAGAERSSPRPAAAHRCLRRLRPRCKAATTPAPGGSQSCAQPRGRMPTRPGKAVGAGTCQCLLAFSASHGLTPPDLAVTLSNELRLQTPAKWPRPLNLTLPRGIGECKRLADALSRDFLIVIRTRLLTGSDHLQADHPCRGCQGSYRIGAVDTAWQLPATGC